MIGVLVTVYSIVKISHVVICIEDIVPVQREVSSFPDISQSHIHERKIPVCCGCTVVIVLKTYLINQVFR
jgi:hypothetical protein